MNETHPTTKVARDKAALRREIAERQTCPGCRSNLFERHCHSNGSPIIRFEGHDWHASCAGRWNKWIKEWTETWAAIGWHAQVDLLLHPRKERP